MRLIDGKALQERIKNKYNRTVGPQILTDTIGWALRQVRQAHTIDPVKHGEWIYDRAGHYYCSNCHTMMSRLVSVYNYCYHCGSKNPPIPIDEVK